MHAIFGMYMYTNLANSQCIPFQKYIYILPKCSRFDFYSIVDKKGNFDFYFLSCCNVGNVESTFNVISKAIIYKR